MEVFRFALLLLVQLSPILVHGSGGAVTEYMCEERKTVAETVKSASAKLTEKCIVDGTGNNQCKGEINHNIIEKYNNNNNYEDTSGCVETQYTDDYEYTPLLYIVSNNNNSNTIKDYKCTSPQYLDNTVLSSSAKLTRGCVLNNSGITFHIRAMYEGIQHNTNTPKTPVVIGISETTFINSYIKIIDVNDTPDDIISTYGPLLFTMSKSNISGSSKIEFGSEKKILKLPPHSLLRIIDSYLSISSNTVVISPESYIFIFYNIELVTSSTIDISHNIIIMECKICSTAAVFYIPRNSNMKISNMSSFTLRDNNITMRGHSNEALTKYISQYVWYQSQKSPLSISHSSSYKWEYNIITMIVYNTEESLYQSVYTQASNSPLTITDNSTYTWLSNIITMMGYSLEIDVYKFLDQRVWYQGSNSPLMISDNSNYKWIANSISMEGYNVDTVLQYLWYTLSPITVSALSQILHETNTMLLLAKVYVTIMSYVMRLEDSSNVATITDGSSMIWKDNTVAMVHKDTDKRHMFAGKWGITDAGSELLLDGNYITTTDKYENSGKLTALLWDPTKDIAFTIGSGGKLTIGQTQVYSNSVTDSVTDKRLWISSSFTSKSTVYTSNITVKPLAIEWHSCTTNLSNGSPIPTMDISSLEQYICTAIPIHTPAVTVTPTLMPPTRAHLSIHESETVSPTIYSNGQ